MQSKNKQNRIERQILTLEEKNDRLQKNLYIERKYSLSVWIIIIALILLNICVGFLFYNIGRFVGEAGALLQSSQQTFDQHSKVKETSISVDYEDQGVPAIFTAYCLKGIMANGKEVHEGSVACPRNIPLGTELIIEYPNGDRINGFVCTDRMASQYDCSDGDCIEERYDIWMDNCQDAIEFGRKELKIIN